jgi:hypothetical protein
MSLEDLLPMSSGHTMLPMSLEDLLPMSSGHTRARSVLMSTPRSSWWTA